MSFDIQKKSKVLKRWVAMLKIKSFPITAQSTIKETMAAVHFPKKANGCLLKDRRTAGGQFV